jgi:ABC-type polysaccharide/polyol phosphate export permease
MARHQDLKFFPEFLRAVSLWRIWLRIGLQDMRMRYRRSALGISWIFLNLAIMIFAIGLVYSHLLGQDLKTFLPFLTVGLLAWGYITSSIVEGGNAFIVSEGYIKQIGLPLFVYVFRFFVSITMTMLISIPAFVVIAFLYSLAFHWGVLWAIFGIILLSIVSFLMIAIFAHLNVRFRDAGHIASVGLQVMFFVTPILWPAELIAKHRLRWIVDFNPFYHLLEVIRRPLLKSEPASDFNYLIVSVLILSLLALAFFFVKRYHHKVAYLL